MSLRNERAEEVRHVEFRAADAADGQTLEGYAAVFNQWTDIRDQQGTYREQIAPGAFKRSLGQRTPVLQFDHGTHPLIGSLPLGTFSVLREDKNGLFVKARLSDNWLVQPVRDAIRDKAISGMSFRFRVIDDSWGTDDRGETRTIKEVELLEAGPVVFPAYEQTSVAVRSLVGVLDDEMRTELARELIAALQQPVGGMFHHEISLRDPRAIVGALERKLAADAPAAVRSDEDSTTDVASVPAQDDSPDEPPVVSHEAIRNRIAAALIRVGRTPPQGDTDVHQ